MFIVLKHMFMHRKLMFIARKQNFSRCKEISFWRIHQIIPCIYLITCQTHRKRLREKALLLIRYMFAFFVPLPQIIGTNHKVLY